MSKEARDRIGSRIHVVTPRLKEVERYRLGDLIEEMYSPALETMLEMDAGQIVSDYEAPKFVTYAGPCQMTN